MSDAAADDPGYIVQVISDDVGRGLFATKTFMKG